VKTHPRHLVGLVSFVAIVLLLSGNSFGKRIAFENVIAFGDSLTDVGNVAGVTEENIAPPD
jgi:phospholipase/lecithinase/hemolysin